MARRAEALVPGVAGLLLTGGASRRMGDGVDKALLPVDGTTLAGRTATLLTVVVAPALEVGPGRTSLPRVGEEPVGDGPLVAIAAGGEALRALGHLGPALVLATDLPRVDVELLHRLASHPAMGSVVPVVGGRPQWLAARWSAAALRRASALVASGERRVAALSDDSEDDVEWLDEPDWADRLLDVDTPADLLRAGIAL